jgi:hypothetical protein
LQILGVANILSAAAFHSAYPPILRRSAAASPYRHLRQSSEQSVPDLCDHSLHLQEWLEAEKEKFPVYSSPSPRPWARSTVETSSADSLDQDPSTPQGWQFVWHDHDSEAYGSTRPYVSETAFQAQYIQRAANPSADAQPSADDEEEDDLC